MAEANGFIPIKAEKVVDAAIGLLIRGSVIARTFWRASSADYRGSKGDAVTHRLPAYAEANKRGLRSTDSRQRRKLYQRSVTVKLTHDLQIDVPITDEELTLDLASLVRQVIAPCVGGIVRGYEEEGASRMRNATYETTLSLDADPYDTLVDAATALDNASVPPSQRFLIVGTGIKNLLLKSERMSQANTSGSTDAFRRAILGEIAGFDVLSSNYLAANEGFAYHRTAYALSTMAPFVPSGAAWGSVTARDGFAVRVMQHLDPTVDDGPTNVVFHDAWVGSNIVEDHGAFNEDGKFVPSVEPDLEEGTDLKFVRAVKITDSSS